MMKRGWQIIVVLLLSINVLLAGYYLYQKQGWHVDEQLSYGHANSDKGAFLSDDIDSYYVDKNTSLHHRWLEGKVFHDYLTVGEDGQFHYGHIKENLQKDVHPPLYYFLLHTICSFTPNTFSPWQAGSINLIAFLLTLFVFYKFSKLFFKDKYLAFIPVILWGYSAVGMATAVFLRMYALQTLFAVCLLYEISKMLIANEADNKSLFLIFLYAALGNLTQFSSLILAFFTALVVGVVLFYRKNFKLLLKFSLVMLLSAAALFAVYPEAVNVLFYSMRGTESTHKVDDFWAHLSSLWLAVLYSNSSSRMFEIYFYSLLGIKKVKDIILLGLALIFFIITYRQKTGLNKAFLPLVAIIILMTLYLGFMMPDMGVFHMRYYMLLMPVSALVLVYVTAVILQTFKVREMVISLLMVAVVITVLWRNDFKHNAFLIPLTKETVQANEMLKNKNIIIKTPVSSVFDLFWVLAQTNKVYWAKENDNILPELSKADFVLKYNSYATLYTPVGKMQACFFCVPEAKPLPEEETMRLKYAAPFRNGVVNFDLYEVIKEE